MSIEQDLRRRLRHFGLEKAYDASIVCDAANKLAQGEFKAVSFSRGVLKISANSAAKAHKLKLGEKELKRKIEELSNARINRLIFTACEEDACKDI